MNWLWKLSEGMMSKLCFILQYTMLQSSYIIIVLVSFTFIWYVRIWSFEEFFSVLTKFFPCLLDEGRIWFCHDSQSLQFDYNQSPLALLRKGGNSCKLHEITVFLFRFHGWQFAQFGKFITSAFASITSFSKHLRSHESDQ